MAITSTELNKFINKNIKQICGNSYVEPKDNHCAHFVSHVMDYEFGYTCKAAGTGKVDGANLRVHEVFARCPSVGAWDDRPATLDPCLVFVTATSNVNVVAKTMANVPKKHIGIFVGGTIWHYSNAQHKVITQVPGDFVHHYPGPDIALFYGEMIP
ncbi:MAG: hypothetical protein DMG79_08715 [Acidobacteria bacterium]|nr:MAG: hypothetical protein DMG79_08715 [Acidobacteriota bacterium]